LTGLVVFKDESAERDRCLTKSRFTMQREFKEIKEPPELIALLKNA
jgi:hypothetical protein